MKKWTKSVLVLALVLAGSVSTATAGHADWNCRPTPTSPGVGPVCQKE